MKQSTTSWRTVDVIVASVIAVAFGVVFWAWGLLWGATDPVFAFFPPAQAVLYGVWLVPAVLGGLVIRKPGAALYCEVVASTVSALLGSQWGGIVILQGLVQGVGAELVFLAFRYRSFRLPVTMLAGALAGTGAAIWDQIQYYAAPEYSVTAFRIPFFVITVASAAVIAGVGSPVLARALARTGVLDRFPAGRERTAV